MATFSNPPLRELPERNRARFLLLICLVFCVPGKASPVPENRDSPCEIDTAGIISVRFEDSAFLSGYMKSDRARVCVWMVKKFREFIDGQEHDGIHREGVALSSQISAVVEAWNRAYPGHEPPIPWMAARAWDQKKRRQWLSVKERVDQANQRYHQGNFREAFAVWQEALPVLLDASDRRAAAAIRMNFGLYFYESGRLGVAKRHLQEALGVFRDLLFDQGIRDCLINQSLVEEMQGNYSKAVQLLTEAWNLNHTLCDAETEGRILGNLAAVALESGYLVESENLHRAALEWRIRSGDEEGRATDLSNLGKIYDERGFYQTAYQYFEQSLRLRRAQQDREGESDSLINLAGALNHIGKLDEAMKFVLSALEAVRPLDSPNRLLYLHAQAGELYLDQGEISEAEIHLQAALALARDHRFPKEQARIWKMMARAAQQQGRHQQAVEGLSRALAYFRQNENPLEAAHSLLELSRAFYLQGDYRQSALQLVEGWKVAEEIGAVKLLAEIHLLLGQIALAREKPGIARQYFQLACSEALQTGSFQIRWQAAAFLSRAFQEQGRLPAAMHYLTQAVRWVTLQESDLSRESLATHFWDDKAYLFQRMSRLLDEQGMDAAAWQWIDSMKGRRLKRKADEEIPPHEAGRPNGGKPDGELAKAIQSLQTRLQGIHDQDILTQAGRGLEIEAILPPAPTPSRPSAGRYPIDAEGEPAEAWIRRLQSSLLPDEALLDYAFCEKNLQVWILGSDFLAHRELAISPEKTADLLSRSGLLVSQGTGSERSEREGTELPLLDSVPLFQLHEEIWKPIADILPPTTKNLVIVPDGWLHLLPFEILPVEPPGPLQETSGPARLIDRYAVSYLPSASLLLKRDDAPMPAADSVAVSVLSAFRPAASGSIAVGGEVPTLGRLFPKANFFPSFRDWKSRTQGNPDTGGLLHIASHYLPDPRKPAASRFFFEPGADPIENFYAAEAVFLPLRARLAVLSACSTAQGQVASGEGLLHMGRSLLLAGVQSIIVSSWPVEENSTAALMTSFYRLLALGTDSRQALRQAKLEIRGNAAWSHPFFWSPFRLIGNPCRLQHPAAAEPERPAVLQGAGGLLLAAVALTATFFAWKARRRRKVV